MNIARQSKKKTGDELYWNYYTSREEVGARIESEKREVKLLRNKLNSSSCNTSKAENKKIRKLLNQKRMKYKEDYRLYRLFELEDKLNENPNNFGLRLKYMLANYMVNITNQKSPVKNLFLYGFSYLNASYMYKKLMEKYYNFNFFPLRVRNIHYKTFKKIRTTSLIAGSALVSLAILKSNQMKQNQ
jgi:hypothetical protein